jgi:hypothetical protein
VSESKDTESMERSVERRYQHSTGREDARRSIRERRGVMRSEKMGAVLQTKARATIYCGTGYRVSKCMRVRNNRSEKDID